MGPVRETEGSWVQLLVLRSLLWLGKMEPLSVGAVESLVWGELSK